MMRPFLFARAIVIPVLMSGFLSCYSNCSCGQDTPQKAYEQLVKASKDKNWEKVFGAMTKRAGDQLFDQMIQMAFQFRSSPIPLPKAKDLQPELEKLFKEYKIDDYDYPKPDFFGGGGIPSKEVIQEYQEKARNAAKEVAKKIGMRKFDFLRRLNKILEKSPFGNVSGMMFNGDIKDLEVKNEEASAFLSVNMEDLKLGGGVGPDINIEIPPIPIKFIKEKNKWKFDGVDEEKALEQLEKNAGDSPKIDRDF